MIRSPIFNDTDSYLWGSVHGYHKGSGVSLGNGLQYSMLIIIL